MGNDGQSKEASSFREICFFGQDEVMTSPGIRNDLFMSRYYWEEMLLAVQQMHDRKVVHLDIKPENFIQVSVNWFPYLSSY